MVKKNNIWGTVCDDGFEEIDAQAACHTLGFKGLSEFKVAYNAGLSGSIVMSGLQCTSRTGNFFKCKVSCTSSPCSCNHSEDILLTCY